MRNDSKNANGGFDAHRTVETQKCQFSHGMYAKIF